MGDRILPIIFQYFTIFNAIQTPDVETLQCNVSTRFGNNVQPDWHKGAMQLAETANKFSGQLFIVLIKGDRNEIYTYFVAIPQQQVYEH